MQKLTNVDDESSRTKSSRRKSVNADTNVFYSDCIFCEKDGNKKVKRQKRWTTEGLKDFRNNNWEHVIEKAKKHNDERLLIRIRGFDLAACGALFHPACKKKYMSKGYDGRSPYKEQVKEQQTLEEAHHTAFYEVCKVIDEQILDQKKVMKLTDLRSLYSEILENTDFPNNQYRSENLKIKLEKHSPYEGKLGFVRLDDSSKYQPFLVYSTKTNMSEVIKNAFILGKSDQITDVAKSLRNRIGEHFKAANELPWPPSTEHLEGMNRIPNELEKFLSVLFHGEAETNSVKSKRLVLSIGQDICREVTNGQWKFAKHILFLYDLKAPL